MSLERKSDGRSGFKVIYDVKQLLTLESKKEAEACITKHLRSIGKIGVKDRPPVKARCRPKAKKKSNICGIILRRETGMYVGSNHDIGSHTTLGSAKTSLDQRMKDGSTSRQRPDRPLSQSGLPLGRVSQLGNATRVVQGNLAHKL